MVVVCATSTRNDRPSRGRPLLIQDQTGEGIGTQQGSLKVSETGLPPPRRKEELPPVGFPGLNGLMTLAVCVVVVTALYVAREVFIPLTLAVLLSFILAPLVSVLRDWRLGRIPSVICAVLLAFGVIAFINGVIGSQIAQLAGDIPQYTTTIESKISAVRG